jgi:hypothetical protein
LMRCGCCSSLAGGGFSATFGGFSAPGSAEPASRRRGSRSQGTPAPWRSTQEG